MKSWHKKRHYRELAELGYDGDTLDRARAFFANRGITITFSRGYWLLSMVAPPEAPATAPTTATLRIGNHEAFIDALDEPSKTLAGFRARFGL